MTDPTSLPEATGHWRALLVDDADCCELLARLKEEYDLQHAEIERLRARILKLDAAAAVTHGTLAQPTPDEAPTITHNVPPSAPPYGE